MEDQVSFGPSELRSNPFGRTADTSYPYLSSSFREALAALYYGLEYGSRILVLSADSGLGKTTLLHHFARSMHGRGHTLLLSPSHNSGAEVLGKLHAEIGGTAASDDLHTMRMQVDGIIAGIAKAENPVILLLDYDGNAAESALETLFDLTGLKSFERGLLRVVIAGAPDVAEKLQGSALADAIRRVPLAPLSAAEVESYIDYRLRLGGWKGPWRFTPQACTLIAQRSSANPSAINEICFKLLQNLSEQTNIHSDSTAPNQDSILDEAYVDSIISGPKPVAPVPAHSPIRWRTILACIVLILVLAMAGLWYRNAAKERAAKQVTAEIAVVTDHTVRIAPPLPIVVPKLTPVSSPVPQRTTGIDAAAVRRVAVAPQRIAATPQRVAVAPQRDSATRTTEEMAAYEIRLGDAYMNLGDYDKALVSFSKAMAFAPDNKEAEEKVKRARRAKAAEDNILQ